VSFLSNGKEIVYEKESTFKISGSEGSVAI